MKERIKILIAGANGFVGRTLVDFFNNDLTMKSVGIQFDMFPATRREIDFSDPEAMSSFYDAFGFFDVVINCAVKNSRGKHKKSWSDIETNLQIETNLKSFKPELYFDFSSGAGTYEDRIDPYSVFKRLSLSNIANTQDGQVSFLLFGCIGLLEESDRFFKKAFHTALDGDTMHIQEKFMDFTWIDDVCKVLRNIILISFSDHFADENFFPLRGENVLFYPHISNLLSNIYDEVQGFCGTHAPTDLDSSLMSVLNSYSYYTLTGRSAALSRMGIRAPKGMKNKFEYILSLTGDEPLTKQDIYHNMLEKVLKERDE